MTIALVTTAQFTGGSGGGTTTPSANTTGANLIVLAVGSFNTGATLSDNKGNTYTQRSNAHWTGGQNITFFDCINPTVGSGHTWSYVGGSSFSSINVMAFSGANGGFGSAVSNTASSAFTSIQAGSITPSGAGAVVISGLLMSDVMTQVVTVDSGFTITHNIPFVNGQNYGSTLAYLIQTTAAATNPTWANYSTSSGTAAVNLYWLPGGGGGPTVIPPPSIFPLIGLSTFGWVVKRRNLLRKLRAGLL